ncbi:WAT1-related protein At4g08290-like [Vicia villosa]|uniref:WAT1-related protein At4g08290-like n=1 Tax=Vicia villosa TaxID=3911 RepID=UPI00273BD476|nr:WAT1-related protein At4g08290-like [Vicia villosa]
MDKIGFASFGSKAKPYVLTVAVQFGFAGAVLFSMASFNIGMSRFVFIVYRNIIAAVTLAPFAWFFERKVRPKMTISVFLQIMALAFLEPVIDQGFTFLGMQYTSASFTSILLNTVPSITFFLAVIFRIEQVNIKQIRSIAKVIGTIVTFAGALLMTIYKGPQIHLFYSPNTSHHHAGSHDTQTVKHWVSGTLFILLGCSAWSSFFILQSITLKKYPAEMSLSTLICFVGALQSSAVALVAEHHSGAGVWALGWDLRLYGPLYTGIVTSGITYYVQGLVLQSRGPVFFTAFNPLCMIITCALGSFLFGEQLHLGSIIGAVIIAMGLYSVVWGKAKDNSSATATMPPSSVKMKQIETQQLPISSSDHV